MINKTYQYQGKEYIRESFNPTKNDAGCANCAFLKENMCQIPAVEELPCYDFTEKNDVEWYVFKEVSNH